jgi:hypothetical protein
MIQVKGCVHLSKARWPKLQTLHISTTLSLQDSIGSGSWVSESSRRWDGKLIVTNSTDPDYFNFSYILTRSL